ncbi:response regulator transcription factor [Streptomyces paromomycinus]|uniref:DNA-binding response regulator n=1 Tax=Streptomyces paromomycinus TaxID=92743 RepID=A0A401VUN5_STREY|nr:response regulator transcription factor [Streptomyces paromomycinus]GCD40783.1 DNA-binding response regulator [Streptomyces paromomycinus]
MICVGLVDSHPIVLLGLERALESASDISVTTSGTIPELLDLRRVDVVLMEACSGLDGTLLSSIETLSRSVLVVVHSECRNAADVEQYIRAGAVAHVPKNSTLERFTETVRRAAAGKPRKNQDSSEHGGTSLSTRERVVLRLIADGLTHAQIARRLSISTNTVNTYIKRVRTKLNLGNKADLTRAALRIASCPE